MASVSIEQPVEVTVALSRDRDSRSFFGTVLDASLNGVEIRFALESAPALAIDETVTLNFSSSGLGQPIEIRSKVLSRTETARFRRYACEFVFEAEAQSAAAEDILKLFIQRGGQWVEPVSSRPIEVRMRGGRPDDEEYAALEAWGRLTEVSTVGIGVVTELDVEERFASVDQVEVTFHLPAVDEPLRLHGRIRSRQRQAGHVRYGVLFDADRTFDYDRQQHLILTYMISRQRELTRDTGR